MSKKVILDGMKWTLQLEMAISKRFRLCRRNRIASWLPGHTMEKKYVPRLNLRFVEDEASFEKRYNDAGAKTDTAEAPRAIRLQLMC